MPRSGAQGKTHCPSATAQVLERAPNLSTRIDCGTNDGARWRPSWHTAQWWSKEWSRKRCSDKRGYAQGAHVGDRPAPNRWLAHCQAVMIAFRAVHHRSVNPMSCGFGPWRMPANGPNCNHNCNHDRRLLARHTSCVRGAEASRICARLHVADQHHRRCGPRTAFPLHGSWYGYLADP
jgi:hypothetical protein